MEKSKQEATPLFDAVKKYVRSEVVPFHVPGHKQGRGIGELEAYAGRQILKMDVNGMEDLDYANHPTGVIKQAQQLMAEAMGAKSAFFLVNGTTSGVQAMIMSVCEPGSQIILPRNAHKSTIGAIILSGAVPVYIQPAIHPELGIAMGVTVESVEKAIRENPCAKAVFVINPTYYGAASDLKAIVRLAHKRGMAVLADEAHGSHMYFHSDFPVSAMQAGADLSAASIHKTAGSLTQSSVLLSGGSRIAQDKLRQVLNLTYTSSASYLLMCSLDIARKQLATRGKELMENALALARAAREEINKTNALYAFGKELIGSPGCYAFDETKLGVHIARLGKTGYQTESILRKKYNIQIELADFSNILAIVSYADTKQDLEALVCALKEMAAQSGISDDACPGQPADIPKMMVLPREAFYHPKKVVELRAAAGEISGEMITAYPPGIPIICAGEKITQDIIDYILYLKTERCELQCTTDPQLNYIRVLDCYM